jgi:hypothetical protein
MWNWYEAGQKEPAGALQPLQPAKGSWDETDFRTPDMRWRLADSLRKRASPEIEFFTRAISFRGREKVPEEDG